MLEVRNKRMGLSLASLALMASAMAQPVIASRAAQQVHWAPTIRTTRRSTNPEVQAWNAAVDAKRAARKAKQR